MKKNKRFIQLSRNKAQSNILKVVILSFLLIASSCSPRVINFRDVFFYDYILDFDNVFWFKDKEYTIFIEPREVNQMPIPIKRYLLEIDIIYKTRICEVLYQYNGRAKLDGWHFFIKKKKYSINDHSSALEPRYEAKIKSFPAKGMAKLTWFSRIWFRIGPFKILKGNETEGKAADDLAMLKYLSQMVWYPTAFLNDNLQWSPVFSNGEIDQNKIQVSLAEGDLTAKGTITFDPETSLPVLFEAQVTKEITEEYEIEKYKVSYHNYQKVDEYVLPKKCIVQAEDKKQRNITIPMHLKGFVKPEAKHFMQH